MLLREATIDDLTDDTVAEFAGWRRATCAAATVNRDLASVLALWRYLNRKGIIDRWPDVPLEPEPIRIPIAWTQEEFEQLLRTTKKSWQVTLRLLEVMRQNCYGMRAEKTRSLI